MRSQFLIKHIVPLKIHIKPPHITYVQKIHIRLRFPQSFHSDDFQLDLANRKYLPQRLRFTCRSCILKHTYDSMRAYQCTRRVCHLCAKNMLRSAAEIHVSISSEFTLRLGISEANGSGNARNHAVAAHDFHCHSTLPATCVHFLVRRSRTVPRST